jgi:tetratricopeptide (TPR) repeat protein
MYKRLLFIVALVILALTSGQAIAEEKDALYWYKLGLSTNNSMSDYSKQVEYYTKAIELSPKWAYAYNNRGVAYYNLAMWEKAKADFDMALKLKPGYKLAMENRAGVNFNKEEAAMEVWEGSYQDRLAAGF